MKIYIIHVLRYGDSALGKHFFGIFDDPNLAHKEVKEYNSLRGGKYPEYEIEEHFVNKVSIFKKLDSNAIVRTVKEKQNYQMSFLTKFF